MEDTFQQLKEYFDEINNYVNLGALVYWNMSTIMPSDAAELWGNTSAILSGKVHEILTSDKVGKLLGALEANKDKLNEVDLRMYELLNKDYTESKRYSKDFEMEFALTCAEGTTAWQKAKIADDFNIFKPVLQKLIDLTKQKIEIRGYKENKYDALLDLYESGLTVKKLDKVFAELRDGIMEILTKIQACTPIKDALSGKTYPADIQAKLCDEIVDCMGFDRKRGVIAESEHPFTLNMENKDVRITNHYYENDVRSALYSAIHECGHALYEQDIPDKFKAKGPVFSAACMSIHESQSRYYENLICKSKAFAHYLYPIVNKYFDISDITEDAFYKSLNIVTPSLVRTEADELTYSIHVIIRYEIEKMIFNDMVTVDELPQVWNQKYEEYLGVKVPNDKEGVLQDMHWSDASFGYFPSYALGNLYGAQMLHTMKKDIPNLDKELAQGNLAIVHNWLNEHVHKYANMYDAGDLIKKITGEELNAKYFLDYLDEKFSSIYGYKR